VAYVVGDPKANLALLKPLVDHPDRLVIRPVRWNRREVEAQRLALLDRYKGEPGLYGASATFGRLRAMVRDTNPELADTLRDAYGDDVEIVMAAFPEQPLPRPSTATEARRQGAARRGTASPTPAPARVASPRAATPAAAPAPPRAPRQSAPMTRGSSRTTPPRPTSGRKVNPMARRGDQPGPRPR
jgi:hypothetical protein